MNLAFRAAIFLTLLSAPVLADSNLLTGNWVTPDQAVVTVYMCGEKTLCTKLIQLIDRGKRWQESRPEFEKPPFVRAGTRQRF
jgi:hypothetical protein